MANWTSVIWPLQRFLLDSVILAFRASPLPVMDWAE